MRWVVDPIDGTTNYLYGRPDWAVSVAAIDVSGRVLAAVVVEPAIGRTTWACSGGGTWAEGRRVSRLEQTVLPRALIELNLGRPADQKPRRAACWRRSSRTCATSGVVAAPPSRWPRSRRVARTPRGRLTFSRGTAPPALWEPLRLLVAPVYPDGPGTSAAAITS